MKILLRCLSCLMLLGIAASVHYGFQCSDGTACRPGTRCPDGKPCVPGKPTPTPTPRPSPTKPPPATPTPTPICYGANLKVNCGLPGCVVSLSGKQASSLTADQEGHVRFPALDRGSYTVTVSKAGYEGNTLPVQL